MGSLAKRLIEWAHEMRNIIRYHMIRNGITSVRVAQELGWKITRLTQFFTVHASELIIDDILALAKHLGISTELEPVPTEA